MSVKLKQLKDKDSGASIAPLTPESAVYDTNGTRLNDKLASKADASALAAKADKTYVDAQLEGKASTSSVSEISTEITDFLKVDSVKTNGNIVLTDKVGNKKEYMAATPSGDPMHYLYEIAGAEYNATGADITKTAPWGESVTHKAGKWYLNGLGDITNEQIRYSYSGTYCNKSIGSTYQSSQDMTLVKWHSSIKYRTNFPYIPAGTVGTSSAYYSLSRAFSNNSSLEIVKLWIDPYNDIDGSNIQYSRLVSCVYAFDGCVKLRHIVSPIYVKYTTSSNLTTFPMIKNLPLLETVYLYGLSTDLSMIGCPNILAKCIAYIINKSGATSAIVITLHATAYARAMADADVQAALASHTNVSLASA